MTETVEIQHVIIKCFLRVVAKLDRPKKRLDPLLYLSIEVFDKLVEMNCVFQKNLFAHACRYVLDCFDLKMISCVRRTIDYILWQWRTAFEHVQTLKFLL
jgi:hypothetical protein